MLETRTKAIDEFTYSVTQLGAVEGRRVFTRLLRVGGPFVAALGEKGADMQSALKALAESLTDVDVDYFCDAFGKSSTVRQASGKEPRVSDIFDLHFAGRYLHLAKWLAFCLEVNFGDFFRGKLTGASD